MENRLSQITEEELLYDDQNRQNNRPFNAPDSSTNFGFSPRSLVGNWKDRDQRVKRASGPSTGAVLGLDQASPRSRVDTQDLVDPSDYSSEHKSNYRLRSQVLSRDNDPARPRFRNILRSPYFSASENKVQISNPFAYMDAEEVARHAKRQQNYYTQFGLGTRPTLDPLLVPPPPTMEELHRHGKRGFEYGRTRLVGENIHGTGLRDFTGVDVKSDTAAQRTWLSRGCPATNVLRAQSPSNPLLNSHTMDAGYAQGFPRLGQNYYNYLSFLNVRPPGPPVSPKAEIP